MSRTLQPPRQLDFDTVAVIWDRLDDTYILSLPDGTSYELGSAQNALRYFTDILKIPEMGQRAIDCARNFYTAILLWKQNRCYGAETAESNTEYEKLFGVEHDTIVVL